MPKIRRSLGWRTPPTGSKPPLPPANVRDPLRLFQPPLHSDGDHSPPACPRSDRVQKPRRAFLVSSNTTGRHRTRDRLRYAPEVLLLDGLPDTTETLVELPTISIMSRSRHSGGVRSRLSLRRRPEAKSSPFISEHAKKRVIGLKNPSSFSGPSPWKSRLEVCDDVGVDQTPYLRLALREIAVQACVLQRGRGLRGKQLQHCDAAGRENVRGRGCSRGRALRQVWTG